MSKVVVLLHFADPSFQAATPTKKTPPKPRVGNEEKLKPTSELLYTLVCIYTVVSYLLITDFPNCLSQCWKTINKSLRKINKTSHLANDATCLTCDLDCFGAMIQMCSTISDISESRKKHLGKSSEFWCVKINFKRPFIISAALKIIRRWKHISNTVLKS